MWPLLLRLVLCLLGAPEPLASWLISLGEKLCCCPLSVTWKLRTGTQCGSRLRFSLRCVGTLLLDDAGFEACQLDGVEIGCSLAGDCAALRSSCDDPPIIGDERWLCIGAARPGVLIEPSETVVLGLEEAIDIEVRGRESLNSLGMQGEPPREVGRGLLLPNDECDLEVLRADDIPKRLLVNSSTEISPFTFCACSNCLKRWLICLRSTGRFSSSIPCWNSAMLIVPPPSLSKTFRSRFCPLSVLNSCFFRFVDTV